MTTNRTRSLWRDALLRSVELHLEGLRNIDDGSRRQQRCCREALPLLCKNVQLVTSGAGTAPLRWGSQGMAV
jgi:hypothetical protein